MLSISGCNVLAWTSTLREDGTYGVNGGSWKSDQRDCRTKYRKEGRNGDEEWDDVGFRGVKVLYGEAPRDEIDFVTLVSLGVEATGTEN